MNERKLSASMLTAYDRWLRQEERADATREKYLRITFGSVNSRRSFWMISDGLHISPE